MRVMSRSHSPRSGTVVWLSFVLSLVFAGCGGSGGGAATAGVRPKAIAFVSPSMAGAGASGKAQTIPVRYTCDGSDTTPSFSWGAVPPNTAELALFLLTVARSTPAARGGSRVEVSVEWAVAGLSPATHAIPAGRLPPGAVVAGSRYSICPAKGNVGVYIFKLNALAHRLVFRSPLNANGLFQEAEGATVASGAFTSSYKRV